MENDGQTLQIKCDNPKVHTAGGRKLAVFRKNFIFIKCGNHHCKRWIRIKVDIPGVKLDFSKVAFTKKTMPKRYHFDIVDVPVVIEE